MSGKRKATDEDTSAYSTEEEDSADSLLKPLVKCRKLSPATADSNAAASPKSSNPNNQTLRIVSWNINDLHPYLPAHTQRNPITSCFSPSTSSRTSPSSNSPPQTKLRRVLAQHSYPDVFCLQEVKLRSGDTTLDAARFAANSSSPGGDSGPRYKLFSNLATDRFNAKAAGAKMYGVMTLVREDCAIFDGAGCRGVEWDHEGRVLILTSNTNTDADDPRLAVVNVYAVNGTSRPYFDPATGKQIGDRHGRKREFQRLLAAECKQLQEQGFPVVVVGDLNVSRTKLDVYPRLRVEYPHNLARKQFHELFLNNETGSSCGGKEESPEQIHLGFVDTFRFLHANERKYTWFASGGARDYARVDLILVSPKLKDQVVEAVILDGPRERFDSDHAPIAVTISVDIT